MFCFWLHAQNTSQRLKFSISLHVTASTLPPPLSGRHRIGFAYESLKDRLPVRTMMRSGRWFLSRNLNYGISQVIIVKCVDELHRTNKERENDEEREAAKDIVEKLVSKQQIAHILI